MHMLCITNSNIKKIEMTLGDRRQHRSVFCNVLLKLQNHVSYSSYLGGTQEFSSASKKIFWFSLNNLQVK